MAGNGPIPFKAAPQGVPIVGQPFTIMQVYVPATMVLTCHCVPGNAPITIVGSVSAQCPSCQKVYNAAFNPQSGKIEMQVGVPSAPQEPA